jgi:hypothetical protein
MDIYNQDRCNCDPGERFTETMSITIQWDNQEKTVLRWDFEGTWTDDQWRQAWQTAMTLIRSVRHQVYGLGVLGSQASDRAVPLSLRAIKSWPQNLRTLVFVGSEGPRPPKPRRGGRHNPRVIFADNLSEAYDAITFHDLKRA